MEKYVTNIKDLVIQTLTNGSEIKAKAESGDALSCFQMGMIHLLGVDTSIDFKKAGKYLGAQSLNDDPDANRLLGFIAECEGNFSQAFEKYANAGKASNRPYINKVFEERGNLQSYLKRIDLPITVLNKEITAILNEYIKGGNSALDAKIKLAYICENETTCLDAAQAVYESGNLFSAISLLQKGNIDSDNPLFVSIKNNFSTSELAHNLPSTLEVIDLEGESFLTTYDSNPTYIGVKILCDETSTLCKKEWMDCVGKKTSAVKQSIKEEEAARIKSEKEKEAARIKKEKEEEAARRRRMEEEERQALFEEQERRRKRNKLIKYGVIAIAVLFVVLLGAIGASEDEKVNSDNSVSKEVVNTESSNSNSSKENLSEERVSSNQSEASSFSNEETNNSGYDNILSERKLSENDLVDKSKKELEIMRNSIYARYGYKFKRKDLLDYFSQYSWYSPTTSDMGAIYNMMNDNEKYNVDYIKKHE